MLLPSKRQNIMSSIDCFHWKTESWTLLAVIFPSTHTKDIESIHTLSYKSTSTLILSKHNKKCDLFWHPFTTLQGKISFWKLRNINFSLFSAHVLCQRTSNTSMVSNILCSLLSHLNLGDNILIISLGMGDKQLICHTISLWRLKRRLRINQKW